MDRQKAASCSGAPEAGDQANASGRQLFVQFKQLLAAAEAKVSGYDKLNALLQSEQRSVGHLEQALQLQQRHIERFSAQDLLVAQLTQHMAIQTQSLEQVQNTCNLQSQQLASVKAEAQRLHQEVGQKRKRTEALEWHSACQQQSIDQLERKLQEYKRICSNAVRESQDIEFGSAHSNVDSADHASSDVAETEASMMIRKELQDSSLAEGAAGLLAMVSSANRTKDLQMDAVMHQSSKRAVPAVRPQSLNTESSNKNSCSSLEMQGLQVSSKRASCLIIARHPQVPRELKVTCKQLTGVLQLGDCCTHLTIKMQGDKLMTPPEFEAAAGCSKGKNWKANIKVQGNNGRKQMLKIWLPGLLQLVGDHSKAEVIADAHISSLLDLQSGLRLLPNED